MTNTKLLYWRLPILFLLLVALESVNLVKLSAAMRWTNGPVLGVISAVCLGCFLVGSIVATSFDLDPQEKTRLNVFVASLFVFQSCLIAVVSYLHGMALMPAADIATLLGTPPSITLKVIAVSEGLATSACAAGFWSVLGAQWRKDIDKKETQSQRYIELDSKVPSDGSKAHARP